MPIFPITLHAYRSWREDNPRGYIQRGKQGVQRPNAKLASHRQSIATESEVTFNKQQMQLLVDDSADACRRRGWKAIAAAAVATHVHVVVEWDTDHSADDVEAGLKSGLGFVLSQAAGTKGNRWFSRGGLPERVNDHAHLWYLLNEYLPKHASEQGGVFRRFDLEEAGDGK